MRTPSMVGTSILSRHVADFTWPNVQRLLTARSGRGACCAQVLGLAGNILSRRFEFQADGFAVALGRSEPLKGALHKLDVKNRSAVNVDAWCAHMPRQRHSHLGPEKQCHVVAI